MPKTPFQYYNKPYSILLFGECHLKAHAAMCINKYAKHLKSQQIPFTYALEVPDYVPRESVISHPENMEGYDRSMDFSAKEYAPNVLDTLEMTNDEHYLSIDLSVKELEKVKTDQHTKQGKTLRERHMCRKIAEHILQSNDPHPIILVHIGSTHLLPLMEELVAAGAKQENIHGFFITTEEYQAEDRKYTKELRTAQRTARTQMVKEFRTTMGNTASPKIKGEEDTKRTKPHLLNPKHVTLISINDRDQDKEAVRTASLKSAYHTITEKADAIRSPQAQGMVKE